MIGMSLTSDKANNERNAQYEHAVNSEMSYLEPGTNQWRLTIRTPFWRPPTDVYETDEAIIVRAEVAGMRDEDFTIEVDGRWLSIHGNRLDNSSRRAYHQMEIRFGEFSIEMELPVLVDVQQVKAFYDNGFLIITLPKARPYHVHIEDQD